MEAGKSGKALFNKPRDNHGLDIKYIKQWIGLTHETDIPSNMGGRKRKEGRPGGQENNEFQEGVINCV